ncbi:radical SAM family heme chaperone HemW [Terasakiella sp. A23]|uniref:radical SAM family heme chaperone HemW n=1 Tax=Terasakiella sp. FCG-A23 TaxID=3080561 RepID=UPI0029558EEA|nr:radical SAM family heme chaperone HemW [Terasakiella sp. A23]MDV7341165.1 radical SAM family heme chaperone HemW [Terasakiella sp. A23]
MSYSITRPFGLYVHWPFCVSKCPYCDFNSHVAKAIDEDMWERAYIQELKRVHAETFGHTISSIFFGGGTPSLMKASTVESIINTTQNLWGFSDDVEITLEANPTTVESHTFRDFRSAGVNRLSIGIQSLREEVLKFLGRAHSMDEARTALDLAAKNFDRYSFDLIYARPDQTLDDWQAELEEALKLSAGHISLYQLTIEPGTDFYKNGVEAIDEDLGADMFDLTQDILEGAGMPAYEISNHARMGQESRHNLIYWQGDDYVGIGPGAHSRCQNQAIHQIYKPDLWLKGVFEKGSGEQKRKSLDMDERIIELLLMGMRLKDGISANHFEQITARKLTESVDTEGLSQLLEYDFVIWEDDHLRTTDKGRKCLNAVLEKLVK